MPLINSMTYYFLYMYYDTRESPPKNTPNKLVTMYLISCYSRGILLMISAFFLGDSIFRIKKAISNVDTSLELN